MKNKNQEPLSEAELAEMKHCNTPTIYNGWEQITKLDAGDIFRIRFFIYNPVVCTPLTTFCGLPARNEATLSMTTFSSLWRAERVAQAM